jgi:hypothetical protein
MNDTNTSFGFEAARHLADNIGIRFSGTPAEEKAAAYVADRFHSLGYAVQEEPFRFLGWEVTAPAKLTLLTPTLREVPVNPFIWSDSTPPGGVEGIIKRDGRMNIIELFEWDKFMIVDPVTEEPLAFFAARDDGQSVSMAQASSTFTVPLVTVGKEDFAYICQMEAEGKTIRARMEVSTAFKPGTRSKNIITMLPGRESLPGVVLAAHYDSQYNTAGAYDNASSVGLILEVARQLRDKAFRRPIYFISFGAEEYLWVGADYHMRRLKERGDLGRYFAMVNIDAILIPDQRDSLLGGSVVHHTQDYLGFDTRLKRIIINEQVPSTYNITYTSPPSPSSDHAPFVREGIPSVKIFDAAPYWFHSPYDTFEKIDFTSWDYSRKCAQRLVEELADFID